MDKITLQYAGNLGRVQGLMEFLDCVYVAHNENLNMDFWGAGAMETKMADFIESHKLINWEKGCMVWESHRKAITSWLQGNRFFILALVIVNLIF